MKKQLLALAICAIGVFTLSTSQAQQTNGGQKHPNVLNLTADQHAKIKAIRKAEKEQAKAIKADATLSADDKKKQLKSLHSSFYKQERDLLTPEQQAKQDSLRASHKPYGKGKNKQTAFSRLNLSDQQKQSLESLHQTQKDNIAAIKSNTALSDQEKQQQIASVRKESRQAFRKLLTPEQKAQMRQIRSSRKTGDSQSNS